MGVVQLTTLNLIEFVPSMPHTKPYNSIYLDSIKCVLTPQNTSGWSWLDNHFPNKHGPWYRGCIQISDDQKSISSGAAVSPGASRGFWAPGPLRPKPGRMVRFGLWSVSREEALFNRLVNYCQVVAQTFDFATATDDALLNLKWKNWSKHLRNLKSKPEPSEMLRCSGFTSQESQKASLKK